MKEKLVKKSNGTLVFLVDNEVRVVMHPDGHIIHHSKNFVLGEYEMTTKSDKLRFWKTYTKELCVAFRKVCDDKKNLQEQLTKLQENVKTMQEGNAEAVRVTERLRKSNEEHLAELAEKEKVINHLRKLNTDIRTEYEAKMVALEMTQPVAEEKKHKIEFLGIQICW